MKDLDAQIDTWSPDRDHSFKIRGETFRGTLGLDYEITINYMSSLRDMGGIVGGGFNLTLDALLLAFLGSEEYARFDTWRVAQREAGNPLTVFEASLIGSAIVEEEAGRPTRASSGSSTGRETNGDGSTGDSTSPGTEEVRPVSLSAAS